LRTDVATVDISAFFAGVFLAVVFFALVGLAFAAFVDAAFTAVVFLEAVCAVLATVFLTGGTGKAITVAAPGVGTVVHCQP